MSIRSQERIRRIQLSYNLRKKGKTIESIARILEVSPNVIKGYIKEIKDDPEHYETIYQNELEIKKQKKEQEEKERKAQYQEKLKIKKQEEKIERLKKEAGTTYANLCIIFGSIGLIISFIPFIGLGLSILSVVFYFKQKQRKYFIQANVGLFMGIAGISLGIISIRLWNSII